MRILSAVLIASLISIVSTGSVYAKPGGGKRPVFTDLDTNEDSFVSFEEFQARGSTRGDSSKIFARIDADSDGFITEQELSSHKPPRRRKRRENEE